MFQSALILQSINSIANCSKEKQPGTFLFSLSFELAFRYNWMHCECSYLLTESFHITLNNFWIHLHTHTENSLWESGRVTFSWRMHGTHSHTHTRTNTDIGNTQQPRNGWTELHSIILHIEQLQCFVCCCFNKIDRLLFIHVEVHLAFVLYYCRSLFMNSKWTDRKICSSCWVSTAFFL